MISPLVIFLKDSKTMARFNETITNKAYDLANSGDLAAAKRLYSLLPDVSDTRELGAYLDRLELLKQAESQVVEQIFDLIDLEDYIGARNLVDENIQVYPNSSGLLEAYKLLDMLQS
jgi:hypothetical protein